MPRRPSSTSQNIAGRRPLALGPRAIGVASLLTLVLAILACWLVLGELSDVGPVFKTTLSVSFGIWWRVSLAASIVAWLLFRVQLPGRYLVIGLLIGCSFLSIGQLTIGWKAAWQSDDGWIDATTYWAGGFWASKSETEQEAVRFPDLARQSKMRGPKAVVWVHACALFPWAVWLFGLAFLSEASGIEELSQTEATWWWFRTGLSRWLVTTLLIGGWSLISVCNEIAASDVFFVRTYAEEIYLGFPLGQIGAVASSIINPFSSEPTRFPWQAHIAVVGSLSLGTGVLLGMLAKYWRHMPIRPTYRRPMTAKGYVASLPLASLMAGVILVPVFSLVNQLGRTVQWSGDTATVSWDIQVALGRIARTPTEFSNEIFWSVVTVVIAICATIVLSIVTSWWMRRTWIFQGLGFLLIGFLWAIPAPLIGVLLLKGVDASPWLPIQRLANQSLLLPIIALTLYMLPWAIVVEWLLVQRLPNRLLEVHSLENATHWLSKNRLLMATTWPWQLALVWFLFVLGMNDIAATNLVIPAGTDTIARRILGLVHAGVDEQVAAVTLWAYAASLVLGGLVLILIRRGTPASSLNSSAAED